MLSFKQIVFVLGLLAVVAARPDSAGNVPLPGPGLSYGGIPYGSVSGNVAEYYNQQAPSAGKARSLAPQQQQSLGEVDFAPIEQWL